MSSSKRSHEGYFLLDHRAGDGIGEHGTPVGPGMLFEAPTLTCSHCQQVMIVNPLRTRERGYCPKCDHYVCDQCETIRTVSGGDCKTFNQIIEEVQNEAVLAEQRNR